jgi:hypothetical protein
MSDDKRLRLKGLLEFYAATLRIVGAANATGAIASGVAFQAFEKLPGAQPAIKNIAIAFLLGVFAFAISHLALFLTQMEMNLYFMGSKKLTEWEKIFWVVSKPRRTYLLSAKKDLIVGIFAGLGSFVLFLFGLGLAITFALGL